MRGELGVPAHPEVSTAIALHQLPTIKLRIEWSDKPEQRAATEPMVDRLDPLQLFCDLSVAMPEALDFHLQPLDALLIVHTRLPSRLSGGADHNRVARPTEGTDPKASYIARTNPCALPHRGC